MDMDISMDIHAKSVDMDMDMDRKFHIHRNPASVCLTVCLFVRPSVTLVDCDHIGWNSSKIISPSVSLGCSLFATCNNSSGEEQKW